MSQTPTTTPNYVELPLDAQYVTPDGMYKAGYIWGKHVRSPKDARQMFDCETYPDFLKGVEDGYGDVLGGWEEDLDERKRKR